MLLPRTTGPCHTSSATCSASRRLLDLCSRSWRLHSLPPLITNGFFYFRRQPLHMSPVIISFLLLATTKSLPSVMWIEIILSLLLQ
jgi:hypothetical protein